MAQISEKMGNIQFNLQQNPIHWDGSDYKPKSFSDVFFAFLDTSNGGMFRLPQLCEKICKVVNLVQPENETVKSAGEMFKQGWSFFSMSRVPSTLKSTAETFGGLLKSTNSVPGAFRRKVVSAIQEGAGCFSTLACAFGPFLKLSEKTANFAKSAFKVADYTTVVADSCDYFKSTEDAKLAKRYIDMTEQVSGVSSDLKDALKGTHRLHMIKTAKAVCSLAGFALGLSIFSGVSALPAFAVLTASLSLLGTILSTAANLHKDSMKYKDVQFFNEKQVQYNVDLTKVI